ncbi:MAG TPA: hypothetical protein DEW35_01970 [Ruminococcaceae bacterium]|nr:hypothetical protein [Oscillospiraceae bacterium]
MAESKLQNFDSSRIREAVCINADRVYDSCCDRDCLEDLRVFFTEETQALVNNAASVKITDSNVLNVSIDVEPISFNKGYYACDLTFTFLNDLDLYTSPNEIPASVKGVSSFTKKVILYGGEGNVKVFTSDDNTVAPTPRLIGENTNGPKCVLQCVDPVALTSRLAEGSTDYPNVFFPAIVEEYLGGPVDTQPTEDDTAVYATLGLFTIVQLIRDVQMVVPVYDFYIPEKQCDDILDTPCDVFRKIDFPTGEFFPPEPLTPACNNND